MRLRPGTTRPDNHAVTPTWKAEDAACWNQPPQVQPAASYMHVCVHMHIHVHMYEEQVT